MQIAKYLGVAPWELPEHSPWKDTAAAAMTAEARAAKRLRNRAERKAKGKRGR